MTAGVQVGIGTEHLQNTSAEGYRCINPLGKVGAHKETKLASQQPSTISRAVVKIHFILRNEAKLM
jgi:hypothetical protein